MQVYLEISVWFPTKGFIYVLSGNHLHATKFKSKFI